MNVPTVECGQCPPKTMKKNGSHSTSSIFGWLVVSTPLKNMKVNGKDYPIYYGKI
jgi:hypothetical protein